MMGSYLRVSLVLAFAACVFSASSAEDPWDRAAKLVAKMTNEEKVSLFQGAGHASSSNGPFVGIVPGIKRLGIPELRMNDGPEGFRIKPSTGVKVFVSAAGDSQKTCKFVADQDFSDPAGGVFNASSADECCQLCYTNSCVAAVYTKSGQCYLKLSSNHPVSKPGSGLSACVTDRPSPKAQGGTSIQWPSGLTVAHSFDPALFMEWGVAMGSEFAGKGGNVQFGPAVNVARVANGGRSFEYLRCAPHSSSPYFR
jgi:hypothetical protein